ncbi:lytic polysaccharide monooxygenase [Actinoplanes sp. NPDC051513]|uniref:lytic polysaccharide monooxygenase n=1 Tax=Actinoplanes sp. NPDC051513 TaxID=3363908 RepID=UPI0037A81B1D
MTGAGAAGPGHVEKGSLLETRRETVMIRRLAAAAAVAGVLPLLAGAPAFAHGAPTAPISRTAACAAGGGTATGTAACKAARAANGGPFGTFDNLRVPNVNGNDKKFVPDGKLCSGGLDAFKGLDIARDDFPSTTVTGGKSLAIKYRATLPHTGSFRIYLTKEGFDPSKKLAWGDLASKPLAEIKDPPLRDSAYQMSVKLPSDRTGRHILYIVWQTSSTVDTYYSCSDVVFKKGAASAAPVATKKKPAASKSAAAPASPPATVSQKPAVAPVVAETSEAPEQSQAITPVGEQSQVTLGHGIVAGALLVGASFLAYALIGGFLRKRRGNR